MIPADRAPARALTAMGPAWTWKLRGMTSAEATMAELMNCTMKPVPIVGMARYPLMYRE